MPLAIFDVDGTLISGKSTEKRFIAWLWRRGYLGPRQVASALWFVIRWFPRYGRHVFRKNKAYLNGLSADLITEEAVRFAAAMPDEAWIAPALAELEQHKTRGDTVLLMSGSLQAIVDVLAGRIGADGSVGTECAIVQGSFTATPPLLHPFYHDKADMLGSICEKYRIAACEVYAYADSCFDIPLLGMVGYPAAVRPDSKLAKWAKLNNHRILQ